MTTKFYLHNATTSVTGTLPGASTQSALTPDVTASGASTNRTMNGTIGASQTSGTYNTVADTLNRNGWFRRYCSPLIAAQTVSAQIVSLHIGASEGNAASNFLPWIAGCLYLWRPSTGAKITTMKDMAGGTLTEPGTTETALSGSASTNTTSATAIDGDILIYELWGNNTQSMGTTYANTVFYDGTVEDSASDNAAYLLFTNDVALYTPPASDMPFTGRTYRQILPQ